MDQLIQFGQQLIVMKLHPWLHYWSVKVPMSQLHHSSRVWLWGYGSSNSMPNCKLSELPVQNIDSLTWDLLFAAFFSCHSTSAEPNLPNSAPCLVWSCQQTSFLLIAPEVLLQNYIHHSLQWDVLPILHKHGFTQCLMKKSQKLRKFFLSQIIILNHSNLRHYLCELYNKTTLTQRNC